MTVIDFAEVRKTKRRRVLDTGLIRFGDMCCSQSVGGRGRTRHRVANRHPAAVHVDRRTEEENLFVLRRLAKGSSHRSCLLLDRGRSDANGRRWAPNGRTLGMKRHRAVVRWSDTSGEG